MGSFTANNSPIRPGFLSAQDSNSDSEFNDILMSFSEEELYLEKEDSLKVSGTCSTYKIHPQSRIGELETTSLELSRSLVKIERKSGFSIWSCISPDLGLEGHERRCSSSGNRSAKVTASKLRKALRKTHFNRIEHGPVSYTHLTLPTILLV